MIARLNLFLFGIAALIVLTASLARGQGSTQPAIVLQLEYPNTVTAIGPAMPPVRPGSSAVPSPTAALECSPSAAMRVVVPITSHPSGFTFCVTASLQGLGVKFSLPKPMQFLTPTTVGCTRLRGTANADLVDVVVSVDDRIRAECGFDSGFLYALSVETQNDPNFIPNEADAAHSTWTISIPWNRLHLHHESKSLLRVNVKGLAFTIPIEVEGANARYASVDYPPFIRLNVPSSTGAPPRIHEFEFDGTYSPDQSNLLAGSFAQNQSTVAVQRALSQALSLAPVTLPTMAPTEVIIGQDLQTLSQPLFAFQQPSIFLQDTTIKPYFDALPLSVTKVSSLASGYAYGYTADPLSAGAFYGLQGPNTYTGAVDVTLALATPAPKPRPTPVPCARKISGYNPLKPVPPPAPILESASETTPPLEVSLLNGFTQASNGARDTIDALAFEGHVFSDQSTGDECNQDESSGYRAETVNLFGRLERDFRTPRLTVSPSSLSQFIGESSTLTAGYSRQAPDESYFQLRETVGMQLDDPYFSPTSGTTTWLSALDGPVVHLTASLADGPAARYFAFDLFGFRLTNANGDIAAQEGWQISVPITRYRGWLLSGGSETQTVSDRLSAVEQGLVSNYASTLTQVSPAVHGANGLVPQPFIRPQRLANARLDTPWIGIGSKRSGAESSAILSATPSPVGSPGPTPPPAAAVQLKFISGYDTGTVTACTAIAKSSPTKPTYQCSIVTDNRTVGGAFVQTGKLGLGATDTSVNSGAASSSDAARNLGTSGGLPGSTTAYLTYSLCPQISVAFTNAAFPTTVPLPQHGTTVSGQLDFPVTAGAQQYDLILGYFNEHAAINQSFNESGFSAVLRLGTRFQVTPTAASKPGACNWRRLE